MQRRRPISREGFDLFRATISSPQSLRHFVLRPRILRKTKSQYVIIIIFFPQLILFFQLIMHRVETNGTNILITDSDSDTEHTDFSLNIVLQFKTA